MTRQNIEIMMPMYVTADNALSIVLCGGVSPTSGETS